MSAQQFEQLIILQNQDCHTGMNVTIENRLAAVENDWQLTLQDFTQEVCADRAELLRQAKRLERKINWLLLAVEKKWTAAHHTSSLSGTMNVS